MYETLDCVNIILEKGKNLSLEQRAKLHLKGLENKEKFFNLLKSGSIEFDYNGHYHNRKTKPIFPESYQYEFRRNFGLEETFWDRANFLIWNQLDIRKINLLKKALNRETTVKFNPFGNLPSICNQCGKNLEFTFDGKTIKVKNPCNYPNGYPPFSIELNIPSGELCFANSFKVPEWNDIRDLSYGPVENFREMKFYAKHGVCQAFCGNSCPSVFRDGDKFYIANELYDNEHENVIDAPPGEKIGSICTDLWAWSVIDAKKLKNQKFCDFSAKVPKGRYRFTQNYYKSNYNDSERKTYTLFGTIERT